MSKRAKGTGMQNVINLEQYTEGMPCHRYLLRCLQDEEDAKTFVKTFVNTMTAVRLPDEYIEADIFMFSHHLPSDSPLKNYAFENWPAIIEDIPLTDTIRMDSSVATYKKCTQYYRSKAARTDACSICPLSKWYKNGKEKEELAVLRYVLESEEHYSYVSSLGVSSSLFKSCTDVLEVTAYAKRPGIYPFFATVFDSLSVPEIRAAHYSMPEKNIICEVMREYLSQNIVKKVITDAFNNASVLNGVIAVMWELIYNSDLCDTSVIDGLVKYLLSSEAECANRAGSSSAGFNDVVTSFSDLGSANIDEFYSSYVDMADAPAGTKKKSKPMVFETITLDSILSTLSSQKEVNEDVKDSPFLMTDEIVYDEINIDSSPYPDIALDGICEPQEGHVEISSGCASPADSAETAAPDGAKYNDETETNSDTSSGTADAAEEHDTPSGKIIVREIILDEVCEEIYEEEGSLVSIPYVSNEELNRYTICLDMAPPRLHTIFESHVLKDKKLCIEMIGSDGGKRYLLLYSPKLHAYFYSTLTNKKVVWILTQLLSYPSIEKYCYYPFVVISSLFKLGMRVKSVFSLFSLSAVLFGGHRMKMSDTLLELGCKPAVGGITIKPEGNIGSAILRYMHSYPMVYRRRLYELKSKGMYADYVARHSFDIVLAEHYQQDLFSTTHRSLFALVNSSSYLFGKGKDESYIFEGSVFLYRFRHHMKPALLVREILCEMKSRGYMARYKLMITSVSKNSFSLYIARNDISRVQMLIHNILLLFLLEKEYRGVVYEIEEL